MRFGAPVYPTEPGPRAWVAALQAKGYRAAYSPLNAGASPDDIAAYAQAAQQAGIVIAEVGVWNNPLAADPEERRSAIERCCQQLALADQLGARCCVNIAGSRGTLWDGPHPDNFSDETFSMIVETVRAIIDEVKPVRTFYTLEPMPWISPDHPDCYLDLIRAIDRPRFAVHLDPVNMITSPRRYYTNGAFIRECFEKLGPYIKSVHAKDIILREQLTTHLDEVRPGLGTLDYQVLLREASALPGDIPVMLEHLEKPEDYDLAAEYVRTQAARAGLAL